MPQWHPVQLEVVVPDGSSSSQELKTALRRCSEVGDDRRSYAESKRDLRSKSLLLLGRHVGGRASGLAKQQIAVSW